MPLKETSRADKTYMHAKRRNIPTTKGLSLGIFAIYVGGK